MRSDEGVDAPPRRPRLRRVQVQTLEHEGQQAAVLVDPAQPETRQVLVTRAALALVSLFDGERDVEAIRRAFAAHNGEQPPADVVRQVIQELDRALLLDSPRYRADLESRRAAYRAQPCRPLTLAPDGFPAEGPAASRLLDGFYLAAEGPGRRPEPGRGPACAGVLAPHIDYPRGGALYAHAYGALAEGAADADLFVILGTDHRGELDEPYTLTRLDFKTPFGRLTTDRRLVDRLVSSCGEAVVENELAHGREHSVEFQAVMLHHALGPERAARVTCLPVLCGQLMDDRADDRDRENAGDRADDRVRDNAGDRADDCDRDRDRPAAPWRAGVDRFIETLAKQCAGRRVCVVAGADLAHLGPAFQTPPLGSAPRERLAHRDRQTLRLLADGDLAAFDRDVLAGDNPRQICSHGAMHTLARLLPAARGELLGYQQCPVPDDPDGGSCVSIAAMRFTKSHP